VNIQAVSIVDGIRECGTRGSKRLSFTKSLMGEFVTPLIDQAADIGRRGVHDDRARTRRSRNDFTARSMAVDDNPVTPPIIDAFENFESVSIIGFIEGVGLACKVFDAEQLGAHDPKSDPEETSD
jgi:hypothetical protein